MTGAGGRHGPDEPDEYAEEYMAGFRRTADGASVRLSAAQAGIVRTLVSQVADLLGDDESARQAPGAWPPAWPGDDPQAGGRETAGEPGGQPSGMDDLAELFGSPGPTAPPDDPVLARLLPDAYRDDPGAAGEFRRYTEQDLRSGKLAAARTVLATLPARGGRVRLSGDDAQVWLRALNDVRLALGVRLGITEDYEEEASRLDRQDPRAAYFQVYDWLTFLQETLVRALW